MLKPLCGPVDYDIWMQCFDADGTEVRLAALLCNYDHINLDLFIIHVDLQSLLVIPHYLHHGILSVTLLNKVINVFSPEPKTYW